MSPKTILMSFVVVLQLSAASFSATLYEGPNGEVYFGDYLPQELKEKGYKAKGAQDEPQPSQQKYRPDPAEIYKTPKPVGTYTGPQPTQSQSLQNKASQTRGKDNAGVIKVSLVNKPWAVEIGGANFRVQQTTTAPDGGKAYVIADDSSGGLTMSTSIARHEPRYTANAQTCRDYYLSSVRAKSPLKMDDIKTYDSSPDKAVGEYMVRSAMGMQINQKHMNVYMAKDGTCIDVHVSKVQFTPNDERLFQAVLDSIRISER